MRVRRFTAWSVIAAGSLALAACKTMPPVVGTALVGFGQDVLAAAAQNFAPQYAASVQNLFLAMAETATGMPFTEPAAEMGADAEGTYAQAGYDDGSYGQAAYEGAAAQQEYEQQYAQQQYEQQQHEQGAYGQAAYGTTAPAEQYAERAGIVLEVALLAQELLPGGEVRLRPVQDGEVLHDGRGDPARGDKIKIFFTTNCACYVYVIGIDATGYVAGIFPDGNAYPQSRVRPAEQYLVPGDTTWWGLDEYRGVEQVYFIASQERRPDIESLVSHLAGQRPDLPAGYRPVREPAIVPMTRGLVQVQSAAPATVSMQQGAAQQISPTLFQSTVADADLVITRWFRHE